ncbi:aspartoacylase [Glaciecola sp. KUL10]|uniref:aspartoacylase n=1 Tax=Glaciecola sp. (strain KUL10) TaxID=2161813 RepID=UPI000D785C49|nr:aspartoacylase [Glaciecola sp. KUL10]GBL05632.1 aspartoacylase [Glaciecola sp. KUL10]
MNHIKEILIVGGTHGNELSGVTYVKNHLIDDQQALATEQAYPLLNLHWHLANQPAIDARTRYCEEDLNRQFTPEKLQQINATSAEHAIALALNRQFGPKGNSKIDLVIDIHNTTSNMGPTLIVLESDEFHRQLASYVTANMPEAVILVEDEKPFLAHKYLCTLGKRGVMIEVGPQPQGVLRGQAYLETKQMCEAILSFCEMYNQHGFNDSRVEVDAFRLLEEISFPRSQTGEISAMIHPELQDKDFETLEKGMPMFLRFDGVTVNYQEEAVIYPHFIGEAAYYHLGIAMASATKFKF